MNRLYNLDYLRGLAAFGIMIYHYLFALNGFTSDTFLGRVGIYGVAIFYVLSGLTLFHVYESRMAPTISSILDFFKKRVLRIYPLLWLTILFTLFLSFPHWKKLLLNLTGLFGFVRWDWSIVGGGWSIGNELVFYCFFPFFIFLMRKSTTMFVILSTLIFSIYLYFSFVVLDPDQTLASQWKNYVNPLNQVFLFLGGFIIGKLFKNALVNQSTAVWMLAIGFLSFILMPTESGNSIILTTGINRIVFTIICFVICIGAYKSNFKLPDFLHRSLSLLGEASYSVYLSHLIIMDYITYLNERTLQVPYVYTIAPAVILTLVLSYFIYQYFERYFMGLGKKRPVVLHGPVASPR